nr:hypothetical protein [Halorhodospira neutriphila]
MDALAPGAAEEAVGDEPLRDHQPNLLVGLQRQLRAAPLLERRPAEQRRLLLVLARVATSATTPAAASGTISSCATGSPALMSTG